ncbi:uncharacterized protein E0L32_008109 [Thyridium curvatum]|uniref:Uncharacterized protein n=1 Tax=Thyridium curvatum TaxID=1093900 RepID=A0A507AT35_9PEZI|nr:uncharacterized protein E0L32_008109 [Thyridium curvatum]TPX10903.1 hypothetical protein E0L32_008109 [Thyridium curvatum]
MLAATARGDNTPAALPVPRRRLPEPVAHDLLALVVRAHRLRVVLQAPVRPPRVPDRHQDPLRRSSILLTSTAAVPLLLDPRQRHQGRTPRQRRPPARFPVGLREPVLAHVRAQAVVQRRLEVAHPGKDVAIPIPIPVPGARSSPVRHRHPAVVHPPDHAVQAPAQPPYRPAARRNEALEPQADAQHGQHVRLGQVPDAPHQPDILVVVRRARPRAADDGIVVAQFPAQVLGEGGRRRVQQRAVDGQDEHVHAVPQLRRQQRRDVVGEGVVGVEEEDPPPRHHGHFSGPNCRPDVPAVLPSMHDREQSQSHNTDSRLGERKRNKSPP